MVLCVLIGTRLEWLQGRNEKRNFTSLVLDLDSGRACFRTREPSVLAGDALLPELRSVVARGKKLGMNDVIT